jgi:endonuclease YncB( thermonuclease family)
MRSNVRRIAVALAVLGSAVIYPVAAIAETSMRSYETRLIQASEAQRISFSVLEHATATGHVISVDGDWITIQTAGAPGAGVVNRLVATADKIAREDYPYVWGGGHAEAGVASTGIAGGPGYNGRTKGFDCSGSVAAVLAGADLWDPYSGVPSDAGVISELRSEGLIEPGAGTGANEVTLYDDPGVHIFMSINGQYFGTSDGGAGNPNQKRGGAGWLYDGAPDATSSAFRRYHFVPRALSGGAGASRTMTVELGSLSGAINQFIDGDTVKVSYEELGSGTMVALTAALQGVKTATATVTSVSTRRGAIVLRTAAGKVLSLVTVTDSPVPATVSAGDTVIVQYTKTEGRLTLRTIAVTGVPAPLGAAVRGAGAGASRPDGPGAAP